MAARHAKNEYHPEAMAQSGSPHYPIDPPKTGFADSSYNSSAAENDSNARGMASEPNLTTGDNSMFLEE